MVFLILEFSLLIKPGDNNQKIWTKSPKTKVKSLYQIHRKEFFQRLKNGQIRLKKVLLRIQDMP